MPLVPMPWVNDMLRSVVSCWRLIQLTGKSLVRLTDQSGMQRWLRLPMLSSALGRYEPGTKNMIDTAQKHNLQVAVVRY